MNTPEVIWEKAEIPKSSKPSKERVYELDISVRLGEPTDTAMVHSAWVSGLLAADPWSRLDKNWTSAAQNMLIDQLLASCQLTIACNPEYRDQNYGFVVSGPSPDRILHWIYVKKLFRRAGVAQRLMRHVFGDFSSPISVTHHSPYIGKIRERWHLERRTNELCRIVAARGGP